MNEREQRVWDMAFVVAMKNAQVTAKECRTGFDARELAREASAGADYAVQVYRLAMEERDDE
jgi:hypothetical protein